MKSACLTRRRLFRRGNEDTQTYSTTQSWLKTWSLILKTSEKLLRKIKDWHVQRTFQGSPLQFRGHDSIPASKTTSYDKTLDLWLCNTEAACMYATRLKLTTSHFLAFLIRKTEFDQMIKPHSTLDPRSFWELSIKDQVSRDFQLSFEQYCIRSQLLPWSYAKFSTNLHGNMLQLEWKINNQILGIKG